MFCFSTHVELVDVESNDKKSTCECTLIRAVYVHDKSKDLPYNVAVMYSCMCC